ncbi:STAS domain-containing protein [Spirillospora albida]|uniref:STAS domain-containing protein n=1 Tax=Spirillospora albida TaxID=58123 RepID=UPI00068F520F|nr:STAS domain-containing protein [Spirillospora albida]
MTPSDPSPDGTGFSLGRRGGWPVVTVTGEVDFSNADVLGDRLAEATRWHTPPHLAVDLSELEFCDSSGLRRLVIAWKRIKDLGGRMVLLNPAPRMAGLLHITGLDTQLEILDALPDRPPPSP